MRPTSAHHRPDIDGLRALAVAMVVVHHAFPGQLPGGFLGVDIFFVISGYLISQILLRSFDSGTFGVVDFYRRRIQRIFPALILVVVVTLALGWWLLWPLEYRQLGRHAGFNAVFLLNLALAGETGYFDADAQLKPLLHLWSIGVEEQFYLVWPWLLLLVLRSGRERALPILAGLAVVSLVTMQQSAWLDAAATFFMPQARAWELTLGGIAALIQHHHGTAWQRLRDRLMPFGAATLVGLGMIALSAISYGTYRNTSVALLLPVCGAMLVLMANPGQQASQMLLGNRPMVGLGLISYPLYLWHWPLLSLATVIEAGLPAARFRVAIVLASVALAWLTYMLLERRIRHTTRRLVPWVLIGLLAATGVFGRVVDAQGGFPARTARINSDLAQFDWDVPHWTWNAEAETCRQRQPVVHGIKAYCNQNLSTPPQVALLGDSHALQLYPGMAERAGRTGESLLLLGASGCPPFLDLDIKWAADIKDCHTVINAALQTILTTPSIRTVIIANRGPFYIEGLPTAFEQRQDAGTSIRLTDHAGVINGNNVPAYQRAMARTLTTLRQAGKQVVLVIDQPEIGMAPRDCIELRKWTLSGRTVTSPCAIDMAAYAKRAGRYVGAVHEVLKDFGDIEVWDLPRLFCKDHLCQARAGDQILYRDANHLSVNGSRWVAERYAPEPARAWTPLGTQQAEGQ